MSPYAYLAILVLLIGSHSSAYFYGVSNGKNAIIAEQKKEQDKAIVKSEEVAKNDLSQAIKVETEREIKKGVFKGIQRRNEDRTDSLSATLSDTSFGLWNDANSQAIKNATSKPANSMPASPGTNEKR